MNHRSDDNDDRRPVPRDAISRRRLLAAGGVVAAGSLAGCLNRVASAVTNTGSSPAAVFAGRPGSRGDGTGDSGSLSLGDPHVSRLTPTVSAESSGLSGEVELEGWVTSTPVVAANYNNTRSNRSTIASPDSAVTDEELERIHRYLEGEAVVAERFTVCLPDAEVPGGGESIAAAVTPERLMDYVTGQSDGGGRVYSWGDADSDGDGVGDCDDSDDSVEPGDSGDSGDAGALCGQTDHLAADLTGPTATGGSLEALRSPGGSVLLVNSPPEADGGPATTCVSLEADADDPCGPGVWARGSGGVDASSPYLAKAFVVAQVTAQPPGCPHPFPALLYVTHGRSDGQLLYTGGWIIDDAALYADSMTALTMADAPRVIGVDAEAFDADLDGDGLEDALERSGPSARAWRGARIDAGPVDSLVESGVLSEGEKETADKFVRKKPGIRASDGGVVVTHLALDAPVFHLVNAASASNEVKFKAGAELSKRVN